MSELAHNVAVGLKNEEAIKAAKAAKNDDDFGESHALFGEARELLLAGVDAPADVTLGIIAQLGRLQCDEGFTWVRQGVFRRHHGDTANFSGLYFNTGESDIRETVELTAGILAGDFSRELFAGEQRELTAHQTANLTVLFRAVQARQRAEGLLRWGRRGHATREMIAEQSMLGRNGAFGLADKGENGYYRTNLSFIGVRAEQANGRRPHMVPWIQRGIKELAWAKTNDPHNFKRARQTAGRLSLESLTRIGALKALDDYRRI